MTDGRCPLAFRATAEVQAGLKHRAQAEGVDPTDLDTFAAWAGDLIAGTLPEVVADLVNLGEKP